MIEGRAAKRKIDSKGWSIQVSLKQYASTGHTRIAPRQAKESLRRFILSEASGAVLIGSLCFRAFSGDGTLHPQTVVLECDAEINRPEGPEQTDPLLGHSRLAWVSEDARLIGLKLFVPGILSAARALEFGLPNLKVVGEGVLLAKLHAPLVEGMEVAP